MTSIEQLDPRDDARFAEFHRIYATAHDGSWDRPYSARELRAELSQESPFTQRVSLLARDDRGVGVGVGLAEFPLKDNRALACLELWVPAPHRRNGHGSALLRALATAAGECGRSILFTEVSWDRGQAQPGNRRFAEQHGFQLDLLDAHRVLELPATLPPAAPRDGYTLRGWRGRCPDEWVSQYATLLSLITQEAPSGELALENEFYDAERVRCDEELLAREGRQMQVSIALSPRGVVAGHTQLVFPESGEDVFQWDTLVLPEHRGHGLGLTLKVHAMASARDLLVGRKRIHTHNAANNKPMIAVNELMGYRHVADCGEYVRQV